MEFGENTPKSLHILIIAANILCMLILLSVTSVYLTTFNAMLLSLNLANLHKPFKIEAWKEMTKSLQKLFHSYPTRHHVSVPTPL